jgi:hypothetical protein
MNNLFIIILIILAVLIYTLYINQEIYESFIDSSSISNTNKSNIVNSSVNSSRLNSSVNSSRLNSSVNSSIKKSLPKLKSDNNSLIKKDIYNSLSEESDNRFTLNNSSQLIKPIKDLINSAINSNLSNSSYNSSSISEESENKYSLNNTLKISNNSSFNLKELNNNTVKILNKKEEDYTKPDINKILLSDSTLLNVNINYNSENDINSIKKDEVESSDLRGRPLRNRKDPEDLVDVADNNILLNKYANNIIKRIPQPFNELRNNRNNKNSNIPCPILVNQPWTEYKSGDSEPDGYNIS